MIFAYQKTILSIFDAFNPLVRLKKEDLIISILNRMSNT
jgi:hypothetical protein